MFTWVFLLRGVNLGAHRKLSMAALREALSVAGLTQVRTYLQSGNVVAQSASGAALEVTDLVGAVIKSTFGFQVPVITRGPDELERVITENPFQEEAAGRPNLVRVIFLGAVPERGRIERVLAIDSLRDTCRLIGNHLYVDYRNGYHTTSRTAPFFTRTLGVDGTERNWRTVLGLAQLAKSS